MFKYYHSLITDITEKKIRFKHDPTPPILISEYILRLLEKELFKPIFLVKLKIELLLVP